MAHAHVVRLGKRIKQRREEFRFSQHGLAGKMGPSVTGSTVSRWERGKHKPRDDYLEQLATALQTTVADLQAGPHGEPGETPPLMEKVNGAGSEVAQRLARVEALLETLVAQGGATSLADLEGGVADVAASGEEARQPRSRASGTSRAGSTRKAERRASGKRPA